MKAKLKQLSYLYLTVILLSLLFFICYIFLFADIWDAFLLDNSKFWTYLLSFIFFILFAFISIFMISRVRTSWEEKENFLAHLRISREGLAIFDNNKRLSLSNPLFNQYCDLISDKILSTPEAILDVPEFSQVAQFLNESEELSNSDSYISYSVDKNGKIFKINCIRLYNKGFEVSINDVTQVEEQERLKNQLTQNIAHEFKTPVSSIQGYLETILKGKESGGLPPEKELYFLERCYAQGERLNGLLQDISLLNKMGAVGHISKMESFNLSELVKTVTEDVSLSLDASEIQVNNQLPNPLFMRGNFSMVYSIFRNLIDNSISYAGRGTTIFINCFRSDEKFLYISFSDNGVGVDDKYLNRLFERFYRIDKGRSRKLGGTGLGLSIVKNAVILHGGSISVKNRVEGGLEFIFTLAR